MKFDPDFTTANSRVALSMRHAWILVVLFAFSASDQVAAQTLPTCDYSPTLAADNAVVIDANTGNIISPRVRFPDGDEIALTFVNKNPYTYKYSYEVKGISVDATTIREFLGLIGALQAPKPKTDDTAPDDLAEKARSLVSGRFVAACTKIPPSDMETVYKVGVERRELAVTLGTAVTELNTKTKAFDNAVSEIDGTKPTDVAACEALRNKGVSLLATIRDIDAAGKTVVSTHKALAAQKLRLDRAAPADVRSAMAADRACGEWLGVIAAISDVLDQNIGVANKANSALAKKAPRLKSTAALIDKVHKEPWAFVQTRKIGPVDEATDYDIAINRTNRADSDDKLKIAASSQVRLGTPTVTYTVGASFGFSDQAEYGRTPSSSSTGGINNVIGITESSDTQVGLVGQLNVRIGSAFGERAWGWALGAAISQGAIDAQLGLYTGPYVTLSKRMYLTGAYHVFEETQLAGGFEVGDTVPDDLQGEIPTSKNTTGAFILTLTYDFR